MPTSPPVRYSADQMSKAKRVWTLNLREREIGERGARLTSSDQRLLRRTEAELGRGGRGVGSRTSGTD